MYILGNGHKPKCVDYIKLLSLLQVLVEFLDIFWYFFHSSLTLKAGEVVPDTASMVLCHSALTMEEQHHSNITELLIRVKATS